MMWRACAGVRVRGREGDQGNIVSHNCERQKDKRQDADDGDAQVTVREGRRRGGDLGLAPSLPPSFLPPSPLMFIKANVRGLGRISTMCD